MLALPVRPRSLVEVRQKTMQQTEGELFAFANRLFHRDFSPINGTFCIRERSLFMGGGGWFGKIDM